MIIILYILFLSITNSLSNPVNTTAIINSMANTLDDETYTEINEDLSYFKDLFNTESISSTEPVEMNNINSLRISTTPLIVSILDNTKISQIHLSTSTIEITTFNPDANEITDSTSYESSTISNSVARVIDDVIDEPGNIKIVQNSSSSIFISFKLIYFLECLFFIILE